MPLVTKTFSDIITFTRTSGATYFDSNGVLQTAGNNVPRLDYNPSTLEARGLLIEEARTNSIRNNTMVGAVAGTPGTLPTNWGNNLIGLTRTVVGTGTENGITYVDIRVNGTTTGQFGNILLDGSNITGAVAGQVWTNSAYVKLVAGSTTNLSSVGVALYWHDAAVAFISTSATPAAVTSSLTRFLNTGTAPTNTAFVQAGFYFNTTAASGQAIDITLRIGLPQLELGAFATSVIPTTTTALTRSADQASVNTLSPWYNATGSTIYAEWVRNAPIAASDFPRGVDFINTSTTDKISVNHLNNQTSSTSQALYPSGLSWPFTTITGVNPTLGVKTAIAFQVGSARYAVNGTLGGSDYALASIPTLDQVVLGSGKGFFSNSTLNGWLRRVTYYPRRLTNAELQAITTP